MKYLVSSSIKALMFGNSNSGEDMVVVNVDSDFAGSPDTRMSQFGYVFTTCGSSVIWMACLQSVVALSTTNDEFMAITDAVKDCL